MRNNKPVEDGNMYIRMYIVEKITTNDYKW